MVYTKEILLTNNKSGIIHELISERDYYKIKLQENGKFINQI